MLRFGLSIVLLAAAAPALAQQGNPPAPGAQRPTPTPEFIQAAQAFGQCLESGMGQVAATVTPEAGATQVLAGCATQRTALETRFEAWISGPGFPEARRTAAREQFRTQLGSVEGQLAAGIRASRGGTAPATPQQGH